MADVVQFPKGDKSERERDSDSETFDKLWGEYLITRGKDVRPLRDDRKDDKKLAALGNRIADLTWQIIRAQASHSYQIDYKFELLREIIQDRWCDGRREALVESIRNDVRWLDDHLRMLLLNVGRT
jgi:hypothetical protein